jgi:hypothetical protein
VFDGINVSLILLTSAYNTPCGCASKYQTSDFPIYTAGYIQEKYFHIDTEKFSATVISVLIFRGQKFSRYSLFK